MKTPKEILLSHHREAQAQLDAVRRSAIAATVGAKREREAGIFERCREIFFMRRVAWTGFAAAWAVIIALNVASSESPSPTVAVASVPAPRSPETLQALREQRQFFTELVGSLSTPDAEAPRFVPRPRSERSRQIGFA
jgi:hypothetical protein